MSAREVTFVGGVGDGDRVTILFGNTVICGSSNTGEREVYSVVTLRGSSKEFHFAIPHDRVTDGDWLIERLAERYAGRE